jgi:hypothetical protein
MDLYWQPHSPLETGANNNLARHTQVPQHTKVRKNTTFCGTMVRLLAPVSNMKYLNIRLPMLRKINKNPNLQMQSDIFGLKLTMTMHLPYIFSVHKGAHEVMAIVCSYHL